jgi:hypothetical protein
LNRRPKRAKLSGMKGLIAALAAVLVAASGGAGKAHAAATQHIWLHYDYMVMPDGQSLAPDPRSIELVVDAFAAHGIDLNIDPHHTALPYHALLDFYGSVDFNDPNCARSGFTPADVVSFADLKAQYFHPTANHDWHYVIFGDLDRCSSPESGESFIGGSEFVVTLGVFRRAGIPITPDREGGTFMHELGHNLGLWHGGARSRGYDDFAHNWKSNYLSVMNYRFQFGIPTASGPKLDYSEEALPTLDESHLDETRGIGATLPSDRTDITSWTYPVSCSTCPLAGTGPASGPIDWNGDGILEPDVAVDLDWPFNTVECGDPPMPGCSLSFYFEPEQGFDDWAWIHAYLAGTVNPGPKTFEHENAASEPIVSAVSPADGPHAGGNTVVVHGAHFEKTTQVTFGDNDAASFTVLNDGALSVVVPPGEGTVDVAVRAGDNPSPRVTDDQYTYLPPPAVSSLSPVSGFAGTPVTISGSNLSTATGVSFGSTPATSFTVVDDRTIRAVAPVGSDTVSVTVTGPGGTSADSPLDLFTYGPTVTSLSPASGLPGTLVTIHGSSFTGAGELCFGQTCLAAGWTVVDDNTITVPVPFSPFEGSTVDVTVATPAGTSPTAPGDLFTLL